MRFKPPGLNEYKLGAKVWMKNDPSTPSRVFTIGKKPKACNLSDREHYVWLYEGFPEANLIPLPDYKLVDYALLSYNCKFFARYIAGLFGLYKEDIIDMKADLTGTREPYNSAPFSITRYYEGKEIKEK